MDTARYKAFVAAAETGSFSRAAELLNYTPSGVSQLVSALEKELNTHLLYRSQKGVSPTKIGSTVLNTARELLRKEEQLYQMVSEANSLTAGSVTVASYPSISMRWLPDVISLFQREYPKIQIHVMEGLCQNMYDWLDNQTADLAFMAHQDEMPYDWVPLAEDPLLAILPKTHPLADQAVYPLQNIKTERFIMPMDNSYTETLPILERNGLIPDTLLSSREGYSCMAMVEKEMGVCIMNELYVRSLNFNVAVLPLDPPQHITMGVALLSLENASPAAKQFLNCAVRYLTRPETDAPIPHN